ncbi:MAG TPA: glycosyltransferase family 1 protein [Acidimicrobiales bacterium]|nr:glycosyltransferase family 1 protein [Acidimicrobiales bacterium]
MTDAPLRVGLDVSAIPPDPRGAGRYVIELLSALVARRTLDLRLESRRGDRDRWAEVAPGTAVAGVVPDSRPRRLVWEQVVAPRFVDSWGIDVLHCPHYTMPEVARVPKVVTIHDLTFFDRPELHERVKVSVFKRAIRVAARRAQAIVCVSDATARRLEELVAPACPVHVIPHGVDTDAFTPEPAGTDATVLAGLGLRAPYVAFLGTLEPRKDLATLVRAFGVIAAGHPDLTLVVAGGKGWGNAAYDDALAESRVRDRIVETGYLPDGAVPVVLRHAAAVAYPAVEEGFGLPVLEALACGAPVVTTSGSVMEEFAGPAVLTAAAGSPDALAAALEDALTDTTGAGERRARGFAVAAAHSWAATAEAHERVYRDVANAPSRRR